MVLTPIFAVCCAFYLIIFFHLKNLLYFSNAVAKPLLFYKRFFFFKSLSARTKLARLFCRSALFSSLGRTEGLFPRLKTPIKKGTENFRSFQSVDKPQVLFLRRLRRIYVFSLTRAAKKHLVSEKPLIQRFFKGTGVVPTGIECSPKISDFRANGIPVGERVDFFDTLARLYLQTRFL